MRAEEFIAGWLIGIAKPRDPDNYCFERGAGEAGGGDGWPTTRPLCVKRKFSAACWH